MDLSSLVLSLLSPLLLSLLSFLHHHITPLVHLTPSGGTTHTHTHAHTHTHPNPLSPPTYSILLQLDLQPSFTRAVHVVSEPSFEVLLHPKNSFKIKNMTIYFILQQHRTLNRTKQLCPQMTAKLHLRVKCCCAAKPAHMQIFFQWANDAIFPYEFVKIYICVHMVTCFWLIDWSLQICGFSQ